MKKTNFGRFAAAGMAAVSAVSAMSIVASASLSFNTNADTVTGTAHEVEWQITKITRTYELKYDATANTISIDDNKSYKVENGSSSNEDFVSDVKGAGYDVYAYSEKAASVTNHINTVVTEANNTASKELADWKKEYEDYKKNVDEYKKAKANYEALKATEDKTIDELQNTGIEFTLADGSKKTLTKLNYSDDDKKMGEFFNAPTELSTASTIGITKDIITYEKTLSTKTLTVSNLKSKFGSNIKYDPNTGTIDKADTTGEYFVLVGSSTTDKGDDDDDDDNGGSTSTNYSRYLLPDGIYVSSSDYATSYYSSVTGVYYPTAAARLTYAGSSAGSAHYMPTGYTYSSSRPYFDPWDGNYYSSRYNTLGYTTHRIPGISISTTSTTTNDYAVYRVGSLYYYSWSDAYSAASGNTSLITWVRNYTARGNYFSRYTGQFYSYYYDALSASNGNSSYIIPFNGSTVGSAYGVYDDPYYYYFLQSQSNKNNSSSNLGGSSVKIGNRTGWNYVRSYVVSAKSGATLDVSLNGETTIPSAIMSALDGKNVTVNFKLSNGSIISFNGKDISNPKEVDVNVVYNAKNVPSKLVSKAKSVNDGVSTAQLTISSNTFGGEAGLNVKFGTNRSGYTAKIYRYNSSTNSLKFIDSAKIGSNGRVAFDNVTQGGEYVIVVC